jgi:flagellar motility protein MotE (MotC chaperone)
MAGKGHTMTLRPRLLPVLVAVASLGLAARLTDMWQGFDVMAQDRPSTSAGSAAPQAWAGAPAQGAEAAAEPAMTPEQAAAAPSQDGNVDEAQGIFHLPSNPLTMTDEEVDLLQSLAERRDEIERRTKRVEEREALLQAAERRIEEKVDGLRVLQRTIEDLLKQHEEQTESQYQSLVKIYENMKPKDAARIFEELEMDILLPVVERMKERKTAPILAKMNADKAKAITTELAQRRLLPVEK